VHYNKIFVFGASEKSVLLGVQAAPFPLSIFQTFVFSKF